jgi:RNA polymerase-binding transcription factor DksA
VQIILEKVCECCCITRGKVLPLVMTNREETKMDNYDIGECWDCGDFIDVDEDGFGHCEACNLRIDTLVA